MVKKQIETIRREREEQQKPAESVQVRSSYNFSDLVLPTAERTYE